MLSTEYSKGSKKDNRSDVMWVFLLAQWMDLPKERQWDLPMVHEMALLMGYVLDDPMEIQMGHLTAF